MRCKLLGLFLALGLAVPAAALAADGDGAKAKKKADAKCGCEHAKGSAECKKACAIKKKAVKAQAACPLTGGKINKKIFADHKGKRVYFCCADCTAGFKKDPAKYVKKLEAAGVTLDKVCKACSGVKGSAGCRKACKAKKKAEAKCGCGHAKGSAECKKACAVKKEAKTPAPKACCGG